VTILVCALAIRSYKFSDMTSEEEFAAVEERAKQIGQYILPPGCSIHCKRNGAQFLFRLDAPDGKVGGVSNAFLISDALKWSDTTFENVIRQVGGLRA